MYIGRINITQVVFRKGEAFAVVIYYIISVYKANASPLQYYLRKLPNNQRFQSVPISRQSGYNPNHIWWKM
jgi:hypothetical protein